MSWNGPQGVEDPTVDEGGYEQHPAFALLGASRVSVGGGPGSGAVLFDSDILHQHTIRIRLHVAKRKRDLNHDWIHSEAELFEVEMSEAQWASFVSTMNVGEGVPCTLRFNPEGYVAELPHQPRLAESIAEVHESADRTFQIIKEARDAYEDALKRKAPAKERNEALNHLHYAIENATSNVDFAATTLVKHTENVVQRARADIEAVVYSKARALGYTPTELGLDGYAAIGPARPRCETCGDTKVITVQYRDHAQEQECDDCCGDEPA